MLSLVSRTAPNNPVKEVKRERKIDAERERKQDYQC